MTLTPREFELVLTGLFMLESDCISGDLNYEIMDELGGIPNSSEIRKLMDKIEEISAEKT